MSNADKHGPLTGDGRSPLKRDRWYGYKGANEQAAGDAHFKQLSERFWGFARHVSIADGGRSLGDILADIWQARFYMLCGVLAGCLCAAAFMVMAVPQTRVAMLIAPANPLNDTGAGLAGDKNFAVLRFIAQRAGVDNSSGFARFENIYDGVSVARILLQDPKIPAIVEADRRFVFQRPREAMSAEKLADYIGRHVRLEQTGASSFHDVVYWHRDAAAAEYFVTRLHAITDELIRRSIQDDAAQRIAYLNMKIQDSPHPDHRRALTDLLLEQERLLMLTSIDQPYAAKVIEPAARYYKPQWPNGFVLFFAFGCVGAFLGFVLYGVLKGLRHAPDTARG